MLPTTYYLRRSLFLSVCLRQSRWCCVKLAEWSAIVLPELLRRSSSSSRNRRQTLNPRRHCLAQPAAEVAENVGMQCSAITSFAALVARRLVACQRGNNPAGWLRKMPDGPYGSARGRRQRLCTFPSGKESFRIYRPGAWRSESLLEERSCSSSVPGC